MGGSYARVGLPPALALATYDANNRLTNWAGTTLSYDDNGNLTGDGAFSYTWDSRDRLTGITGTPASSFAYDPAGRRMTRTVAGTAAGYVYDGWNVVHTHAAGTINSTLLNGLGLDERYSRTNAGGTVAFLTDALGSTLHLRSAGGANTATYTYEPYGAAASSGTDSTAFGYTGREDDGNGLMYYRNRYYHPRFSRFISEDPIGLAGGDNAYRYVDGDPTGGADPLGLAPFVNSTNSPVLVGGGPGPGGGHWGDFETVWVPPGGRVDANNPALTGSGRLLRDVDVVDFAGRGAVDPPSKTNPDKIDGDDWGPTCVLECDPKTGKRVCRWWRFREWVAPNRDSVRERALDEIEKFRRRR